MKLKLAVLSVLVLASVFVSFTSASAAPNGMTATVSQVLVNRLGGITASGTMNCTNDVTAYYAGVGQQVPANLTVVTGPSWTATQPAGRHTSITASWNPDHANPCYNTNPSIPGAELCPAGAPAPCSWITSHFGSSDTPFYVYATNGKFVPGPIHVDLITTTGYVFINGVLQDYTIEVFSATGFNLRAVRVR